MSWVPVICGMAWSVITQIDVLLAAKDLQRLLAGPGLKNLVAEILQHGGGVHQHEGVVVDGQHDQRRCRRRCGGAERLAASAAVRRPSSPPAARARPSCPRPCGSSGRAGRPTAPPCRGPSTGRGRCPCPTPLVVKNGSVARASVAVVHALAGVGDRQADVAARRQAGGIAFGRDAFLARRDDDAAAVGHGVARVDREVEQRHLELVGVGLHAAEGRAESGSRSRSRGRASAAAGRSCRAPGRARRPARARAPAGGRRPACAGSATAPRWAAWMALSSRPVIRGSSGSRLRTSSRLPRIAISRLLKSWATPPVSWPMASIFCDWNSASRACSSALLRLAPLGDVAGDLGEADQLAVLVADRVDDDVGPEAAAVLAHAPALRLEAALAQRRRERRARLARSRDPPRCRSARSAGR